MKSLAVAIAVWCQADHNPYKSFEVCVREMRACVKESRNWEACFVVPEDLTEWGDEWGT